MGTQIVLVNGGATEGSINTYNNEKIEIPSSEGAKSVVIRDGMLDVDTPDLIDGISQTLGTVLAGNHEKATSQSKLSTTGNFGRAEELLNSDGTDILWATKRSPVKTVVMTPVPKDNAGKFYITIEVVGVACTGVKAAHFSGSAIIIR